MPYTDYLRKAHAPVPRSRRPPPSSFGYRGYGDPRLVTPLLSQFLILSVLVHMLVLLLFGSPSGGSKEGRALWGSLDVTLVPAFQAPAPPLRMERSFGLAPKPVPRARPPLPAPRAELAHPPPAAQPPPAPPAPPAPAQEPIVVPRMIERLATPETKREIEPAFQVPLPTKAQVAGPPRDETSAQSMPTQKPEPSAALPVPQPAPTVVAPRKETLAAPPIEAAPITERLAAPRIDRTLVEPPILAAPVVQPPAIEPPIAAPVVPVVPPAAPVERVPIEAPRAQPAAPAVTQPSAPPVEKPAVQEAPAAAKPPVESLPAAPVMTESATAKPAPAPVTPPREQALPAQSPVTPGAPDLSTSVRPAPKAEGAQAPARPSALPSAPQGAPRGEAEHRFTAPKGESAPSPFGDLPMGRSAPDAGRAPPALDLDAMRKRAGQIAREGSGNRAALPFPMPPVPPKKSKMEQAIENARKPDCRNAYSALGLAAIVPLIANEFGEGTCRW